MGFDIDAVNDRFPEAMLTSLMGGTYDFYGVDGNAFCIGANGARMVLEALEDPSDGYRSYFGCFRTSDVDKIFFGQPIARVRLLQGGHSHRFCREDDECNCEAVRRKTADNSSVHEDSNFSGWVLEDVDSGHLWLTVGTDYGDDYYPCFTFRYQPDPTKKVEE